MKKTTTKQVIIIISKILEHLYIHKQIVSQSCIHICPTRQVFPLTEFPIRTKYYIIFWQREQQKIAV